MKVYIVEKVVDDELNGNNPVWRNRQSIEVIGNKFENPELLEEV